MRDKDLLSEHAYTLSWLVRLIDIVAIIFAGMLAYRYRFGSFAIIDQYRIAIAAGTILLPAIFSFAHIYAFLRGRHIYGYFKDLIQGTALLAGVLACLAFLTDSRITYSKEWFCIWLLLFFCILAISRMTLLSLLIGLRKNGWNKRAICIIGAGELGREIAYRLSQEAWTGFKVVAFFDDNSTLHNTEVLGIPVKKITPSIARFIKRAQIKEVWFALPFQALERVDEIAHHLRHSTAMLRLVPNLLGERLLRHKIMQVVGFPVLNLNLSPIVGMRRFIKEVEDRILAGLILLLISPLFLLIALGTKFSSAGPVFFTQLRYGWDGRVIKIYKFRTMRMHQEDAMPSQATQHDARVTKWGKFLRKTSLDELPQLFNVLQGRMSLVGPRPHAVAHNEYYKDRIEAYMQRHKVKPGITGWAQVNGWRGETETIEKMAKRIEYDLYYIENWSLLFDLKIIFLTLVKGFVNTNAY